MVLFGDPGGQRTEDALDEWYRTLLVARTPDRPGLFEREPRPDAILGLLETVRRSPVCQRTGRAGAGAEPGPQLIPILHDADRAHRMLARRDGREAVYLEAHGCSVRPTGG